ncbi:MAG: hypothetical protein ACOY5U_09395 [Pseudomonadota bacterium]
MKIRPEIAREIAEAIAEGVRAGVYRRAERLNPRSAPAWNRCAAPHSRRAAALLDDAMAGLGVERPGPGSRGRSAAGHG